MAAGTSRSYTCRQPGVRKGFVNTATVVAFMPGGNPARDSASAPVKLSPPYAPASRPAIHIIKSTSSQSIRVGGTATFRITIVNTGNVQFRNVKVKDPLARDCDRDLGALAAGKSRTYSCARPNVAAAFLNRADVVATTADGQKVTDSDTAAVTTKAPEFTG